MYLNEIYLENTGPISKCHVKLPFDEDNPLPVVIVGPNGSGKTIFLSYIVDAFFEFAKKSFSDIVITEGLTSPYFRFVGATTVRSRQSYSLSLLHFNTNDSNFYYCEKMGKPDMSTYSDDLKSVFSLIWNKPTEENPKCVTVNEKTVETEMRNGSHAFFPASRHEDPSWLNPKSLKIGMDASANRRFNDRLDKPILVETCAEENISWVLDVFLDSLIDLLPGLQLAQDQNLVYRTVNPSELTDLRNRDLLRKAKQNVEQILQEILQDKKAKLTLNYRGIGASRISIEMSDGKTIPTLQSLSEGQSQLFHLFATIIRYGERTDLHKSVHLSDITGLVVIDEIDANLHPTLQHDVLPQLIKMFPKVQFIVSSHSPLFLLGMEKRFGADRVTILEMPEAERINSERYSEFGKAFEFFQSTESYEADIKQRFANMTKPVVLTEGKTDAKYIQTALQLLGEETLLNSLEIQPVGVKVEQEWQYGGKDGLNRVNTFYKKDPSLLDRMLLLLYDWDANKEDETGEKIWIRFIPENPNDPDNKSGIENLFSEDLFEDRFYDEEPEKGIHGRNKVDPKFKKIEFCQWICDKRRNPDDFEKFKEVVQILKEFVEAAQQPPPE